MALSNAYLTGTKNLAEMLVAIRSAQAPTRFTVRFLQDLGFKSTSDRLIIGVLKGLGFIDESGIPKQRYHQFLDGEISKQVLAAGVREAYADLFALNVDAHQKDGSWVKGKLKTLTQGSKSDDVIAKMAMTFVALCKLADFAKAPKKDEAASDPSSEKDELQKGGTAESSKGPRASMELVYRIHLELPAVRDQAVYDAIFKSLRENLL